MAKVPIAVGCFMLGHQLVTNPPEWFQQNPEQAELALEATNCASYLHISYQPLVSELLPQLEEKLEELRDTQQQQQLLAGKNMVCLPALLRAQPVTAVLHELLDPADELNNDAKALIAAAVGDYMAACGIVAEQEGAATKDLVLQLVRAAGEEAVRHTISTAVPAVLRKELQYDGERMEHLLEVLVGGDGGVLDGLQVYSSMEKKMKEALADLAGLRDLWGRWVRQGLGAYKHIAARAVLEVQMQLAKSRGLTALDVEVVRVAAEYIEQQAGAGGARGGAGAAGQRAGGGPARAGAGVAGAGAGVAGAGAGVAAIAEAAMAAAAGGVAEAEGSGAAAVAPGVAGPEGAAGAGAHEHEPIKEVFRRFFEANNLSFGVDILVENKFNTVFFSKSYTETGRRGTGQRDKLFG